MPEPLNTNRPPSVDVLLRDDGFTPLLAQYGHTALVEAIRGVLAGLRENAG